MSLDLIIKWYELNRLRLSDASCCCCFCLNKQVMLKVTAMGKEFFHQKMEVYLNAIIYFQFLSTDTPIGLVNFGFDERSVAGSMDVHTLQFTGRNYNPIITITLHRRTLQEGKNDE